MDWIKRSTSITEDIARAQGIRDWVDEQRLRKWKLAGHIARRKDGPWSTQLITWIPVHGRRNVGRPLKKWNDELKEFIQNIFQDDYWWDVAQDRATWLLLQEDFVNRVHIK